MKYPESQVTHGLTTLMFVAGGIVGRGFPARAAALPSKLLGPMIFPTPVEVGLTDADGTSNSKYEEPRGACFAKVDISAGNAT
jgi:hypothetical protein